MNEFRPPSMMSSCMTLWMNPITRLLTSARSTSLFVIARCIEASRPESGFQSNHSDRRLSTARASIFAALLTVRKLANCHRYPSVSLHDNRRRIKHYRKLRNLLFSWAGYGDSTGVVDIRSGSPTLCRSSSASCSQEHPMPERHRRGVRRGICECRIVVRASSPPLPVAR